VTGIFLIPVAAFAVASSIREPPDDSGQLAALGGDTVLYSYVHDLYEGERMRPEKLRAWRALRERYGNRDESRVDRGTLLAPAA